RSLAKKEVLAKFARVRAKSAPALPESLELSSHCHSTSPLPDTLLSESLRTNRLSAAASCKANFCRHASHRPDSPTLVVFIWSERDKSPRLPTGSEEGRRNRLSS